MANRIKKTEQINLRLSVKWLDKLTHAAAILEDEVGDKVNVQDIIKLTLKEKFKFID